MISQRKGPIYHAKEGTMSTMQIQDCRELGNDEIEAVSGGIVILAAPVVMKIGAWAAGAAFGAGVAVVAHKLI